LDLFHFPARGREHADYLLKILKEKGEHLAWRKWEISLFLKVFE
jgi:hypothetical protein